MKPGWLMKGGAAYLGDFTNKFGLLGLHDLNTETQTKLFANTLMLMYTMCSFSDLRDASSCKM